ncbi:hypothetical protein BDZ94DRAFT_1290407 [Collybia nuda]|uniref:FAS1 domain-containing protein n=1 Tax=Collybia nuda TaxID=64659 RepID=A0A9P5Y4I1_9AGAR|nr:hypothetical protein BDZ94DRAFT_1290407 [Collybia nuda]
MRLWPSLPLVLLLVPPALTSSQSPWSTLPPTTTTTKTTIVDALSADPDYLSLLLLLQRARLIPTLNRLQGCTLFAPTNDAIKRHTATNPLWRQALLPYSLLTDNVEDQLRQQLFYHLLNYSIPILPDTSLIQTHNTLLFPRKHIEPPSREPPPFPPWLPIPGGTLGGAPQRLRLSSRDEKAWVGVDALGKAGTQIIKSNTDAGNGVLLGIADVLEPPLDLARVVSQHSAVSYFHKVLTSEIIKFLSTSTELTLFLPVNDAWDHLDPYERLYLESPYATDDLNRIVNMHAVVEKGVRYSDSFGSGTNLTTIDGTTLEIVVSPEKTMISTANLVQPDIYASNGVLHLVDSLLVPPGALQLTPEKYLLALNCTAFVSLLHSVNLTSYINDTEAKYTILAPKDEVLSIFGEGQLPERGSDELKRLLQYHFIPGRWISDKLKDGMLLETALEEEGLDGGRQVLSVEVSKDEKKPAEKAFRFGGAGIIGEPFKVNKTLVYFISRPLVPPVDPLQSALPFLDLSSFLAAIFSTSQAETLRTTPRTSLLIPLNSAFKRLGMLVSAHLLAASSKPDLENVLLHHALKSVEYAEFLRNGSQRTFATLEGSDMQVDRMSNGTVFLSSSGGWTGMKAELYPQDLLTQTGVIHEVSDILIPRSVHLTVGKLVKAAKGSTMASMAVKAGFEWVLNGTAPPEGSPWVNGRLPGSGWTLLCPTDDAFKGINLTQLYADVEGLHSIVTQHLIPSPPPESGLKDSDPLYNNRPLSFDDSPTYTTLQSSNSAYGDIVFQRRNEEGTDGYIVGIKGARGTDGHGDWARVLSWGRSTTGGGGVIQIDRLLIPYHPPWWLAYGAPTGVGALGMGLICLFFYGVRAVWRRDTAEATYEPSNDSPAAEESRGSAVESAKSFIAGGFGGVSAVLVGHPFDLTKTRLQTAAPGVYTGAVDVVKKTLARDGLTGLYRGMVPPLLGVTPIFAVSFWAYDTSKNLIFTLTPNRTSQSLSTAELAAAGFMSAVPTTLITAPVERAKVLLQVQGQGGSGPQYKGVLDVMKHLYKEGGMRSIFRGSGATLARDGPGSAAYFAAYEVTKKALTPAGSSSADLNLSAIILAGGTAGVAMWALAIPPDVLKSRIQSAPTGTYSGMLDCARKTIAQDGVRALWRGFGPAMARAFPANAATFLGIPTVRPRLTTRSPSASEIARNIKNFETWSAYQCCEQVSYSDIPEILKTDVTKLFDATRRLPSSWVDKVTFLGCKDAETPVTEQRELYAEISVVFCAWKRLQWMRKSREKWSEADYAANVYNVFRSPAVQESTHRVHCSISLPQPVILSNLGTQASRILNTKTVAPDCAIFIPAARVRSLSHAAGSPFKTLKSHASVAKTGNTTKGSSFRFQSTPCAILPDTPSFEFASSFWEDKKPVHQLLEDAYRQNRMATAAAVRHLHSLHIHAPILGLVWASGTVRAHVDWCNTDEDKPLTILSAPYPGAAESGSDENTFHEWQLDRPSDILAVYFLIRNLDRWTNTTFRELVVKGVNDLRDSIVDQNGEYFPWKRVGELGTVGTSDKENVSNSTSAQSTPPKMKQRRYRVR